MAEISPKLLQIGGKVAIFFAFFGEKWPHLVTLPLLPYLKEHKRLLICRHGCRRLKLLVKAKSKKQLTFDVALCVMSFPKIIRLATEAVTPFHSLVDQMTPHLARFHQGIGLHVHKSHQQKLIL